MSENMNKQMHQPWHPAPKGTLEFLPGASAPVKGIEGLMFSREREDLDHILSATIATGWEFCQHCHLPTLEMPACKRPHCLGEQLWQGISFYLCMYVCIYYYYFVNHVSTKHHRAGAKNHRKALGDLVWLGGTFPTFCPLKRHEVGRKLRFNL